MISKLRLREIFSTNMFLKDNSEKFFNKSINTLCKKGTESNIISIIEILDKFNLLYLVIKCPSILAKGKSTEIEKIIKLLDTIDGHIENIGGSYLLDYEKIKSIVTLNCKDVNFYQNCILYLKLKGLYNIVVTEKQLIEIADMLPLSYEEFLNIFFDFTYVHVIKETLRSQGYVYLGEGCPVREEELNKYGYVIAEVLDIMSKKYHKIMKKTTDEAHDFFFDVFLSRCGSICINAGRNISYLSGSLVNYLKKCIFLNNDINHINYDDVVYKSDLAVYDDYSMESSFMDKYSYLSIEDQFFLSRMSYYIESEGEYIKGMQAEFNLNINQIKERLLVIRNAIEEHEMVKKKIRK